MSESPPAQPGPERPSPERPVERPIPRGCNPLVFGVVMATIQMGLIVYFMGRC